MEINRLDGMDFQKKSASDDIVLPHISTIISRLYISSRLYIRSLSLFLRSVFPYRFIEPTSMPGRSIHRISLVHVQFDKNEFR